jgi:thioredoxin 1
MMDLIIKYSDNRLIKDILKSDKPILIEIGAKWCGGSHLIAPIIEKIEAEFNNRIRIIRVEYDSYKEFLTDIGIEGIPSIILVKNGNIVEKINGTISRKNLTNLVTNIVDNNTVM